MAIDNFSLWHASVRHPAGNIPLPDGEPCVYTYICGIFVCFGTYLFARTLLAKTLNYDTGRPSGTCGRGLSSIRALIRVAGSQSFFSAGGG